MKARSRQLSQAARTWRARLRRGGMSFAFVVMVAAVVMVALSVRPRSVQAYPSYLDAFRALYGNTAGTRLDSCVLCHINGSSAGPLNAYGADFRNNAHSFANIAPMDSDGDGFSNIDEINALTFPGNAADVPAQPTATRTATSPAPTATRTPTSPAPTAIPTTASPTATSVAPNPTATFTTSPGSATPTATPVTPSTVGLDLDIRSFKVSESVELDKQKAEWVQIRLDFRNSSAVGGQGTATVVGVQNGVEVYNVSLAVSAARFRRGRTFFPNYLPTAAGKITWTVSLDDGNPDDDTAVAITWVTAEQESDDDSAEQRGNRPDDVGGNPAAATAAQPAAQPVAGDAATTTTLPAAPPVVPPVVTEGAPAGGGACAGTHVVLAGENLFRIGFNCGFSLQQMASANGIGYPYKIYPGQALRFP